MASRVEDEHELGDVEFTEEDVMEKLRDLKPDKCPGPDKIHPHVLKECCEQLAKPLFLLFRKSLDEGELPADWKTATVSPIFKKGSKTKADDTKIYGPATTEDEVKAIQDDLEKLQLWSENWLLKFNAGKCKTMHMGSRNLNNNYHMGQTILDSTEEEKDLVMVITSDCKQSTQCSKAAAKGMNSLRVIRRTFKYIDAESFLILHKAYIRPHLEYCVQSWNPALQKDINALEKVQRIFYM